MAALRQGLQTLQADALFILGDLVEAWVGDDALELPWAQELAQVLRACGQRMPLYFQHGNRDFLLGGHMAQACGMQLLAEVCRLEACRQRVVLVHGDEQCLDDSAYQAFRAQVRQANWQQSFLSQPLPQRLALARQMREASRKAHGGVESYGDLDPAACQQLLILHHAQTLLHGHTHRPGQHALANGQRLVLSDWDFEHAQRGEWLLLEPSGWRRQAL
ncbi:UDP-2,3-diacylglucosamine hydrolase [Inhella inkyongensis]|uniref:UDP-2,3-diacylglucosamine hydrolase n=1 Tax=Inhella inkyongensis TaxID=392593 RepID=A0A840S5V6_9BURK|nr:UDP-2,3-diacylglucosamine diphosphatase [Inhella inkyongensis]MBB5203880.1 UDP-2,3-diacylglucosamine hydrolase [Inhella inkyongensis]